MGSLSGHDRIIVMRAHHRMASHYAARAYDDMASVVDALDEDCDPKAAAEAAAAEIRVALTLTRRSADVELGFALELRDHLPRVWRAPHYGAIDVSKARTIAVGTMYLPDDQVTIVGERIIARAPHLTTGQLVARLLRLCPKVDSEAARNRYEEAVDGRLLATQPDPAGTAHLMGLDLPPHRVAAVTRWVFHVAHELKRNGETRAIDQLRADVFLDLLTGAAAPGGPGPRGVVDVRADLTTLGGLDDSPGELRSHGPVAADIARQVAEAQRGAEWRFTVTDSATGQPVLTGITRLRPTRGQRRAVESRDVTCVFAGCRMPATKCDLDHPIPCAQNGTTHIGQLVPSCRYDYRIRHEAGWTHKPTPGGGHRWTTRLGLTYTTSRRPP